MTPERAAAAWRSVLFVPGNRPDFAAKASRHQPGAVVLDLEDAVPAAEKGAARDAVADAAARLAAEGVRVLVRVNAPASEWFDDDVAALPRAHLQAVVVPKFEGGVRAEDVGLPVLGGLETVRGVADARALLAPGMAGCYFGAEDFVVDLGGVRTESNAEVAVARASVAIAARLAGIPAYDMVVLDFHDRDRFVREAAEARALGYAGKLCIHPSQVPLAEAAFVPSPEEVDRARRLLAVYEEAVAAGRATVAFDGTMVDEVVARHARRIIAAADPSRS